MSNYIGLAWHPVEKVIRRAYWLDDYFGGHQYGVKFDEDGPIFPADDCEIDDSKVYVEYKP